MSVVRFDPHGAWMVPEDEAEIKRMPPIVDSADPRLYRPRFQPRLTRADKADRVPAKEDIERLVKG